MYPHVYLFFVVMPENAHTHTHTRKRKTRARPSLSRPQRHTALTFLHILGGESPKKREDFCSQSFSLIARASAHTFKRLLLFVFTRAPLGLLNRVPCARHIARVYRRKERKHALLKEEEEEEVDLLRRRRRKETHYTSYAFKNREREH